MTNVTVAARHDTGAGGDLSADRLRSVAQGGFGVPDGSRAEAMAWFRDRLYLGISAPATNGADDRAQILARNPATGEWETVFTSPDMPIDAETLRPRAFGIRALAVFQGKSDPAPCFYCGTMSVWGGMIMRSEDGVTFAPVSARGIDDDTQMSFHGLTGFGDLLFALPAGTSTAAVFDRDIPPCATVYVSQDPAKGAWSPACMPGFGAVDDMRDNHAISALAVAHGQLYAATSNPIRGFQLWRTLAVGLPPYDWERVLVHGAWRFTHNPGVTQIIAFKGDLYIGTGITGPGYDRQNDVGPCAAELLRLRADGSWDLLMGEPRFTPDGLKVPLSALGPGFGDVHNAMIRSLGVHKGMLYAGTRNWAPHPIPGTGQPIRGGCQLWVSADGEVWTPVRDSAVAKLSGTGIRHLCSTPDGLYLSVANPARNSTRQAKRRAGGVIPQDQPTKGFDVFLAE